MLKLDGMVEDAKSSEKLDLRVGRQYKFHLHCKHEWIIVGRDDELATRIPDNAELVVKYEGRYYKMIPDVIEPAIYSILTFKGYGKHGEYVFGSDSAPKYSSDSVDTRFDSVKEALSKYCSKPTGVDDNAVYSFMQLFGHELDDTNCDEVVGSELTRLLNMSTELKMPFCVYRENIIRGMLDIDQCPLLLELINSQNKGMVWLAGESPCVKVDGDYSVYDLVHGKDSLVTESEVL